MHKIKIRKAELKDIKEINSILNFAILNTNYNLSTQPRSDADAEKWFSDHMQDNYPVIVAELDDKVIGWASLSRFRTNSGYNKTAEVSIYVSDNHRHKGVGTTLLNALISMSESFHCLIAVITENNWASLALHSKCGFMPNATFKELGYKNDKYIDVILMTKLLEH